jgi:hypothetical protein
VEEIVDHRLRENVAIRCHFHPGSVAILQRRRKAFEDQAVSGRFCSNANRRAGCPENRHDINRLRSECAIRATKCVDTDISGQTPALA